MATTNQHKQARVAPEGAGVTRAAPGEDGQPMGPRLTSEQVWDTVAKASFAVVTAAGVVRQRSARACRMTAGLG